MTGSPIQDADISILTLPHNESPNPPRRTQRWLIWAAICTPLAAILAWLSWSMLGPSSTSVVTLSSVRVAGHRSIGVALNASGYVVAQRQASVASKGTGRLEYLAVNVGSEVQKGEMIARVQQDDVQALQRQARARLEVAIAALTNARAELRDAEQSYGRAESLLPKQFISQAEFDAAQNRLRRTEAIVRSSSAAIKAAEADVQTADVMLENTVIRAPFDGTVLKKFAEIGEVVAPMASSVNARGAVVLIADMTSLVVETEISESSIAQITPGQHAEIVLDALPGKRYPGVVQQIVPTADRSKGTVLAKVRFQERDDRVFPEMSAKIAFSPADLAPGGDSAPLLVPTSSLAKRGGQPVVYVFEDEIAREIPVEVIGQRGTDSEIRGALSSSAIVILAPSSSLTSGAHVRVHGAN